MENDISKKIISRYNLAKASVRFFARLLDFIFISLISLGLFFIIFNTNEIQGWQMLLFSILVFFILSFYFIIIPFLTNGYTLFKKIFKIKVYSILLKNITKNKFLKKNDFRFLLFLLKKESMIWFIWSIFFIIFGIICIIMGGNTNKFILEFINPSSASSLFPKICNAIFITIFSILFIFNAFLLVNLFMTSGRRCFNDNVSNTVVIKMIDVSSSDKKSSFNKKNQNQNNKIKYKLPGEISSEALNDI